MASSDTTANGVLSIMTVLDKHPDIHKKLKEEISSVIPDDFKLENLTSELLD